MYKIIAALCSLTLAGVATAAGAEGPAYPNRTVTVVVPFTPGDGSDTAARLLSDALAKKLNQNFVVLNRPGAGGALGVEAALQAEHDGYTILFTTQTPLTIRRVVDPATAAYDPHKDLIPLGGVARFESVIAVRSNAPYKNARELVEYTKRNPGKVRFGTPGFGSLGELNLGILNAQSGAGIELVPYKSSTPAVTDTLGGHVDGVATSLSAVRAYVQDDKSLRAIVISKPFPGFDTPTLSDLGYQENILGIWVGFFAPAGAPQKAVDVLSAAVQGLAKDRELSAKLSSSGMLPEYLPPSTINDALGREVAMIEGIRKKFAPKPK